MSAPAAAVVRRAPVWGCPLLCEGDHWSCTASDYLHSCVVVIHRGGCPLDFGPWGAWRAVVGRLVPLLNEMDRPAIFCGQTTGEEIESWFEEIESWAVRRLEWSEELIALAEAAYEERAQERDTDHDINGGPI